MISDINQQPLSVTDVSLLIAEGSLFNGRDNHGDCLWRTDGTAGVTYRFSSEHFGFSSININGIVFFEGSDYELHKTDGTAAGTVLVKDKEPSEDPSQPNFFFNGMELFFKKIGILITEFKLIF